MGRHVEIPYFDVDGEVVWGATAMMIAELRELLGTASEIPSLGHEGGIRLLCHSHHR